MGLKKLLISIYLLKHSITEQLDRSSSKLESCGFAKKSANANSAREATTATLARESEVRAAKAALIAKKREEEAKAKAEAEAAAKAEAEAGEQTEAAEQAETPTVE